MEALKGKVQTVRGPIDPSELGPTLMHEHLLFDFTPPDQEVAGAKEVEITLETVWEINYNWVDAYGNRRFSDRDLAVREMERLKRDGGRSLVEVTPLGGGADPEGVREIAERADVNVVMGCGRYMSDCLPAEECEKSVDDVAAYLIDCVTKGIDGTDVRAGIIAETGCSWPWTEEEKRSVHAGVIAQKETGATFGIHPSRTEEGPFNILAFLKDVDADLPRTIMDHIDRRIFDGDSLRRLADSGINLEFDMFGFESSFFAQGRDVDHAGDAARLSAIRLLVDAGHLDQIVISQDICTKTRQTEHGGHGYGHIFRNILPMMRRRDFTDDEIDAILVRNPARLLTLN
jgi:phosphotriesterase-related protein